ncbi:MAG: helix-turn-helix domain containing protein [Bifidobacteriaceae bacterium]|jgi:transcriptional regulator with XRE-family HTH domain|nr:helix-turn-helix domain containing protein [Bifidobacteriaceae bacterium]
MSHPLPAASNVFELVFEVDPISQTMLDRLYTTVDYDVMTSGHSGVTLLTAAVPAASAIRAADAVVSDLLHIGIRPLRLVEDLVSRSEIARRAGVTPQAVGQWLRGERREGVEPPRPYVLASGQLWLWGEVRQWLTSLGQATDDSEDDIVYPTRRDHMTVNGNLAADPNLELTIPLDPARTLPRLTPVPTSWTDASPAIRLAS